MIKSFWEDYLEGQILSFIANSEVGMNTFKIVPINQPVRLQRIEYSKDASLHREGFSGTMFKVKPGE